MKKFFLFTLLVIVAGLFLCRCVLSQMRWSDRKAQRVFKSKHVPLQISDTVIDSRHIHYAVSGSDFGKAMHLQEQCALLLPVLRQLKNDRPMILCGHSYGGPTIAKLAADAPGLFKTLVFVAGSLDPSLEKTETWRHVMNNKPLYWFLPGAFQPSNTELLYLKEDLKPFCLVSNKK